MAQQPVAILADPLVAVIPTAGTRLTARFWTDLGMAMVAFDEGNRELSQAIVGAAEAHIGTNAAHRQAVMQGADVVRARIRAEHEARQIAEQRRAKHLMRPLADPGLGATALRMLKQAEDHRAKAKALQATGPRRNRAAINEHLAHAARLGHEALYARERDVQSRWIWGAMQETKQLAQRRGEEVSEETVDVKAFKLDTHGAVVRHKRGSDRHLPRVEVAQVNRITLGSRGGGLVAALAKGWLGGPSAGRALYLIGARYHDAFEIDEGHRSNAGEGGGGYGPKGPQIKIVEAGQTLAIMRRGLKAREQEVLDHVCGCDFPVRQAAAVMGCGFRTVKDDLRSALGRASLNWQAAKDAGEMVSLLEHMQQTTELLRRVR